MHPNNLLSLFCAILILALIGLAVYTRRKADQARSAGYDMGYDDAKQAFQARINALNHDLALHARRTTPCALPDVPLLREASEQLDLLSRTFIGLGARNKADLAKLISQQVLAIAERMRESLESQQPSTGQKRTVVVYGPEGCGKTVNAHAIADALGLADIRDGWVDGAPVPRFAALVLTSETPPFNIPQACTVLSFEEAMQLVETKRMEAAA